MYEISLSSSQTNLCSLKSPSGIEKVGHPFIGIVNKEPIMPPFKFKCNTKLSLEFDNYVFVVDSVFELTGGFITSISNLGNGIFTYTVEYYKIIQRI